MEVKLDQSPSNSCSGSPAKKVQEGVFQSEFLNFIIEGAAAGGKMSKEEPSLARCLQCQEPKPVLKYVIPTLAGQKSFCSEPCLMNYKRGKFTVYVRLFPVWYYVCNEFTFQASSTYQTRMSGPALLSHFVRKRPIV